MSVPAEFATAGGPTWEQPEHGRDGNKGDGRAKRARDQRLRHWGRRLQEERRIGEASARHHSAAPVDIGALSEALVTKLVGVLLDKAEARFSRFEDRILRGIRSAANDCLGINKSDVCDITSENEFFGVKTASCASQTQRQHDVDWAAAFSRDDSDDTAYREDTGGSCALSGLSEFPSGVDGLSEILPTGVATATEDEMSKDGMPVISTDGKPDNKMKNNANVGNIGHIDNEMGNNATVDNEMKNNAIVDNEMKNNATLVSTNEQQGIVSTKLKGDAQHQCLGGFDQQLGNISTERVSDDKQLGVEQHVVSTGLVGNSMQHDMNNHKQKGIVSSELGGVIVEVELDSAELPRPPEAEGDGAALVARMEAFLSRHRD